MDEGVTDNWRAKLPGRPVRLDLPVGSARVSLLVPTDTDDETGSRLSMWWGLTTSEIALAEHLSNRRDIRDLAIVELGCGLGLAGVVAACRGASVTFTDFEDRALQYSQAHAELNGVPSDRCRFVRVDWSEPPDIGPFDLVLGAEVAYDYFFHDDLIRLVDRWVAPAGHLLLADRKRLVVDRALGRLVSRGFRATETRRRIRRDGFPVQEISLWELRRVSPLPR